jgi:hypothetical protein
MVLKTAAQKTAGASMSGLKKPLQLPEYGAKLLRQAIPLLQLTPEEATLLRAIASRNDAGARRKDKEPRGATASPPPVVKAATATAAAEAQGGKQLAKTENDAELKRLERLRRARTKAERESLHEKSKLTTFARRAPGSFEGGKS